MIAEKRKLFFSFLFLKKSAHLGVIQINSHSDLLACCSTLHNAVATSKMCILRVYGLNMHSP